MAMSTTNQNNAISPESAWISRFAEPLDQQDGSQSSTKRALEGLCFAVKDNIDVAQVPTTAGCPDFRYTPLESAYVVNRLLEAGARLIGKTNLDQFACGLSGTRSPYGVVPNSFNPAFVCGGSSSGSAYVVATGQADFALGTDTAGSGRVPAGLNNIIGLKPSKGLISTRGVVPAARSVDCVSIFARDVATAWRVFLAACAEDPEDPYARALTLERSSFPNALRVGIPDRCEWFDDHLSEACFRKAINQVAALGGTVVTIDYSPLRQCAELLYESALVSERLEVTANFVERNPDSLIKPVYEVLKKGASFSPIDVFKAIQSLRNLERQSNTMWSSIDVLMVPTVPRHYLIESMIADPIELNRRLGYYTNFVNLLDFAAIAVPSSIRADGLPFGVTFIAPAGSDFRLAELGARFHEASQLCLGRTDQMLTEGISIPRPPGGDRKSWVRIAVVGAHLRGMPLNWQLEACDARFVAESCTTPDYRLFALANTEPQKPGLVRVSPGQGQCIALEIWELPISNFGSFVSQIPAPLGIGQIQTLGNGMVQGFLCEHYALQEARDITRFGGWRAYQEGRVP
jgi:allophanate hydrolase